MDCLIDLSSITDKTLPLILAAISIILSGNLIRGVYCIDNLKDPSQTRIHFKDTIVLSAGVVINWTALYLLNSNLSLEGLQSYSQVKTWLYLAGTTAVFAFITWRYRVYGKKWINDKTEDIFLYITTLILTVGSANILLQIINFDKWNLCQNVSCQIGIVLEKIFALVFCVALAYSGFKVHKSIKRIRRYRKNKSPNTKNP